MSFWSDFVKYVGIQGVLAIVMTVALVVWVSSNIDVPQEVWGILGVIYGFWFAKNGVHVINQLKK